MNDNVLSQSHRFTPADAVNSGKGNRSLLGEQPYFAYSYSYPHKSAYGSLDPPVSLREVWQHEDLASLFVYVHIPFCEMRCGFCNLFTRTGGDSEYEEYLKALQRQFRVLSECTGGKRSVSRLAIGGGTPTILTVSQMSQMFDWLNNYFGASPSDTEGTIETSPSTATRDKIKFLNHIGMHRISIGVQSFVDQEVHAIGRRQDVRKVHSALETIRDFTFPVLNIDLIYGQPHQTVSSWMTSVEMALRYSPEEMFLYPLYIRPETGISGKREVRGTEFYQECYRNARDRLIAAGYQQFSMRCFRIVCPNPSTSIGRREYSCQEDGMLGLGCGARSYTQRLHYGSPFAVQMAGVHSILERWISQSDNDFGYASWGVWLSDEERHRRFVIQSILNATGLNTDRFKQQFHCDSMDAVPELRDLIDESVLEATEEGWRLTEYGLELSDAIGPFLYSPACRRAMIEFTCK